MFKIDWKHPKATQDHLGYLWMIFSDVDPRPCSVQVNERYTYGGGWSPMQKWTATPADDLYRASPETVRIKYPGDPAFRVLFDFKINAERVFVFDGAWVMIVQPDGSHEIARMD